MLITFVDDDYLPFVRSEEFSNTNQEQIMCFSLTIVDDTTIETTEVLFLQLRSDDPSISIPNNADQLNVTIFDDDSKLSL